MHPGSSIATGIDAVAVGSTRPCPPTTPISGPLLPGGRGGQREGEGAERSPRRGTYTREAKSIGSSRTIEVPSPDGLVTAITPPSASTRSVRQRLPAPCTGPAPPT